jgi:hypothetical protein
MVRQHLPCRSGGHIYVQTPYVAAHILILNNFPGNEVPGYNRMYPVPTGTYFLIYTPFWISLSDLCGRLFYRRLKLSAKLFGEVRACLSFVLRSIQRYRCLNVELKPARNNFVTRELLLQ